MGARQSLKVAGMGENRGKLSTIQLAAVRHMSGYPFCQFRQDAGMRIVEAATMLQAAARGRMARKEYEAKYRKTKKKKGNK